MERIIASLEEGTLSPVAALGDVMGNAGKDEARQAGHAGCDGLSCGMTPRPIGSVMERMARTAQLRGNSTCHCNNRNMSP